LITIKSFARHIGIDLASQDLTGLVFVNLVETDMIYGHRNNPVGYAEAVNRIDEQLGQLLPLLGEGDLLFVTADHGCDPGFLESTDHTREYVPLLATGPRVEPGVNLGTRETFADLAATVCDYLGCEPVAEGSSFLAEILRT